MGVGLDLHVTDMVFLLILKKTQQQPPLPHPPKKGEKRPTNRQKKPKKTLQTKNPKLKTTEKKEIFTFI